MAQQQQQVEDADVVIKFGGGINSSASEDQIEDNECATGQNFEIDFKNFNLRNRKPFDLMGTAPNAGQINGFVNLRASDGTVTMLVQAGTAVYQWSQSGGFVSVGSVTSGAKIRGPLSQYWALTDSVIITDLGLVQPVGLWDGSSFTSLATNLAGDFIAKYCFVDGERARFCNVISNSTATPHMIVTSKLSDYTNLTTANRPSSSLGAADPYYLLTPDLRPINGIASGFGVTAVSSAYGSIFQITGADATDTVITDLYTSSGAAGTEPIAFVSNDFMYGKVGRIESLISTLNFGDVLANDLSFAISDAVEDINSWEIAYNPRTQKVYFHPTSAEYMFVMSKILLDRRKTNPLSESLPDSHLSPWSKFVTAHSSAFNPTAMMCCVDPDDLIEYVYFGDSHGNLYRMEGTGTSGDAGSADVTMVWRSKLLDLPSNIKANSFKGYVSYRSGTDETITVKLLHAGSRVTDETCTVSLKGTPGNLFWGGSNYWGGTNYWGVPFSGRFRREDFTPTGGSEQFQIEVTYTGTGQIEINEIGLKFDAATM